MRTHKEGLKLIAVRQSNTSAKSEDIFFVIFCLFEPNPKNFEKQYFEIWEDVFSDWVVGWLKKKSFRAQKTEFNIMRLHDEQVYSSLMFNLCHVTTLKP